jgi:hypothetical protein
LPHGDVPHARGLALSVVWIQDGLLRVVTAASRGTPRWSPDDWIRSVITRHTTTLSRPEFLKAVRALSARYVESRAALASKAPLDSAGKRAAFAAFYAPLHYLTVSAIIQTLRPPPTIERIVDLGCGTGVAGLAWAATTGTRAAIVGVDRSSWALDELRWNCREMGYRCRAERAALEAVLEREVRDAGRTSRGRVGLIAAWSINELRPTERATALDALVRLTERGAVVLVVEPLALSAVPWWQTWQTAIAGAGGRADEWRLPLDLPSELAELDQAAGFRREALTARTYWLGAT